MKINIFYRIGVFYFFLALVPFTSLHADPELYSFPDIGDAKPKKEEPKPVDPFLRILSKRMDIPENILSEASQKGMGRVELTRLILMAKKSGKALPELILQREKRTRMAKIAESTQTDNRAISKEAKQIVKEVEKESETIKPEVGASTGTPKTAGVEEKKK